MPTYHHTCDKCSVTTELQISFADYGVMEEDYGRSDGGDVRFPCDEDDCGGWSERDYSFGVASFSVKGGTKYQTRAYRADAEHEWMKQEIENTKGTLLGKKDTRMNSDYNTQRPYAAYTLDEKGAEDMGFKRVSAEESKARAEVSKKTTGEEVAKVEKARKSTIIED